MLRWPHRPWGKPEEQVHETNQSFDKSIAVIPHGNYAYYEKYVNDEEEYGEEDSILFFGRLFRYKGLEYLIRAEPLIAQSIPDFKIVLACHGEPLDYYRSKMTDESRYRIMNRYIADDGVPRIFKSCSVVVLPKIEASQSDVLFIAFCFKKPVIVTDVGTLPASVENGWTGNVEPPGDEHALAKVIVAILKNPDAGREIGRNEYRKAMGDYSWETIARNTLEFYTFFEHYKYNE